MNFRLSNCILLIGTGVFIGWLGFMAALSESGAEMKFLTVAILLSISICTIGLNFIFKQNPFAQKSVNRNTRFKYKQSKDFLLYLSAFSFPDKDRDVEIGNMLERHELSVKRHGKRRALRILAWDVAVTYFKIAKYSIEKIVKKVLKLFGLYQLYRMFFG